MKKAVEKGETLPTEARFDSNCITPGTEFMVRLHEQLQYFVVKKTSTDSLWQGVRIILSGHEVCMLVTVLLFVFFFVVFCLTLQALH